MSSKIESFHGLVHCLCPHPQQIKLSSLIACSTFNNKNNLETLHAAVSIIGHCVGTSGTFFLAYQFPLCTFRGVPVPFFCVPVVLLFFFSVFVYTVTSWVLACPMETNDF